jgi:diguanylate cyclase
MSQLLPKAVLLLNPIILAIVLAYSYSWVKRLSPSPLHRNLVMGGLMGVVAALAMLNPLVVAEGVIVDLRNLVVGLTGAFFGIAGVIIAIIASIAMRVSLGGAGMVLGVLGILMSGMMGLVWANTLRHRISNMLFSHIALGTLVSVNLILGLLLPQALVLTFFTTAAPWIFVFNIIGVAAIGWLIAHEERLVDERSELISAANTDPLTKLHNRRSLVEAFNTLPASPRSDGGLAVLCFDIDHFKGINDTHGHLLGDEVLLEITRRVSTCLRPSDLFARIGGDEFLIVLPDVTRYETTTIAERCRSKIASKKFELSDSKLGVSISVGVNWTATPADFTTLLSAADDALYSAKSLGRDCVAYDFQNAPALARAAFADVHAARA